MKHLLAFFVLLALPSVGSAHVWRVEKNGGGDFVVLQDALDVVASGDSISIGPGRYDDWETYGAGGNVRLVCGVVRVGKVTIIGSGMHTIIGPEQPWSQGQGQTHGFEVTDACSVLDLRRVAVENFERGVVMAYGDSLYVTECEFRQSRVSIAAGSRFASIAKCGIIGIISGGHGIQSYFQDRVVLADCWSSSEADGSNVHFQAEGPSDVSIANCRFEGASGGVALSRGPTAEISMSEFIGQVSFGIAIDIQPSCRLLDCVFRDQYRALVGSAFPGSKWFVDRVAFESVAHSTLSADFLQDGYFHECQLAAGDHGIVSSSSYPVKKDNLGSGELSHFDMRGNWWGTAESDSIAGLIYDYMDDNRVEFVIDYDPHLDGPTVVESRSLGDIKALFR